MKPMSTNVFLQVAKNAEVTRGKIWAVQRMLKCFPAISLKLIPHQIAVRGWALSCKWMIPSDSILGHFDFMEHRSTLSHQEVNHTSAFLCWPPFPILDEHTLHYAHLQSNKETTVLTCAFALCMSPTLKIAVSIHNSVASFCEDCVLCWVFSFHMTAKLYIYISVCSTV